MQKLPCPINKADTETLMREVDLVVATGSQNNIRSAYSSGTPAVGVGAGNVSVIVDETADLAAAAEQIIASKTFDNATSCSSETAWSRWIRFTMHWSPPWNHRVQKC